MEKAIIACKALYPEIISLTQEMDNVKIEFLPQGLHNLSNSSKMRDKIQQKIDELEEENNYDYIILGYGLCSKGVEGLKANQASLVIAMVHDCISLLVNKEDYKDNINFKNTFFLSKGWIEHGGDPYKEFLSMTEQLDGLISDFKTYIKDKETDWYERERYSNNKKYDYKTAKWITYECIKNYKMIALIDNGNLDLFHYQYLEEKYRFIKELLKEYNKSDIEYSVLEGDISILEKLIFFEKDQNYNQNILLIASPGESIKLEDKLIEL